MLALALLASVLLPLLPAAGRLHQARLAAQAVDTSGLHALCTTAGLRFVEMPLFDPVPDEAPRETGHGHDCAYCPLLAATALPGFPAGLASRRIAAAPPRAHWTDAAAAAFRDRARGARAPPRGHSA